MPAPSSESDSPSPVPDLWELSVRVPSELEDPWIAAFESACGVAPTAIQKADSPDTRIVAYLDTDSHDAEVLKREILRRIESSQLLDAIPEITVARVKGEDWSQSWKHHFHPISIKDRLLINPSWIEPKPLPGQKVLTLDPGLSFGTGHHATTRYCLEQIASFSEHAPIQSFLDVGTGSGILAIGAALCGAIRIKAVDNDEQCIKTALENARTNQVQNRIQFEVEDLESWPADPNETFQVVCANLIYDVLITQKEKLIRRVRPGGALILAGILSSQFDQVVQAYETSGFVCVDSNSSEEWKSGVFSQNSKSIK